MNERKRFFAVGALLVAGVVVLAVCVQRSVSDSTAPPTEAASATSVPEEAPPTGGIEWSNWREDASEEEPSEEPPGAIRSLSPSPAEPEVPEEVRKRLEQMEGLDVAFPTTPRGGGDR